MTQLATRLHAPLAADRFVHGADAGRRVAVVRTEDPDDSPASSR